MFSGFNISSSCSLVSRPCSSTSSYTPRPVSLASLEAVGKALGLLLPGGVLVICAYPGHEEGGRERTELQAFLSALDNRRHNVLRQHFLNAGPGAPECFVIQKNK